MSKYRFLKVFTKKTTSYDKGSTFMGEISFVDDKAARQWAKDVNKNNKSFYIDWVSLDNMCVFIKTD